MGNGTSAAVLGFRPHTYWTAVVALSGSSEAPHIVERRRIVFATGRERFIFHQAATLALAEAERRIDEVRAATEANAAGEIEALIADLRRRQFVAGVAVSPAGSAKRQEPLETILGAHARIHAAEGSFYRDVVAAACGALGLDVRRVIERELPALACKRLGIDDVMLGDRMKRIGETFGPPWNEDYRLATLAAWVHLDDLAR